MSTFKINIQAMGILKDYFGIVQFEMEVPSNSTVEFLLDRIRSHPMVHTDLPISVVCLNEFCNEDQLLKSEFLYYIIPPVSGG
jgi:hypothetical protein